MKPERRLPLVVPRLPGIPPEVYIRNLEQIRNFIAAEKLTPVAAAQLRGAEREWHSPWGGMRMPHLHLEGDLYLLNTEQWQRFSGALLKSVREKLAVAKTVSFDQAMEISEAVEALV
jgi:hypothetical protein